MPDDQSQRNQGIGVAQQGEERAPAQGMDTALLGDAGAASDKDEAVMDGLSREERRATMHGAPLWARTLTVAAGALRVNFWLFLALVAVGKTARYVVVLGIVDSLG